MRLLRRTIPKSIERQVVDDYSQQWRRDLTGKECEKVNAMQQWWTGQCQSVYRELNPSVRKPLLLGPGNVDKSPLQD